ncbi:MAG: PASTA domain-containing protein [Desulfitobacterium sp.]|nr:PASTA domain-containing protein [Desulfitobacterium sp.]
MKNNYFRREIVLYGILLLLVAAIISRLFTMQVIDAAELRAKGIERRTDIASLVPERGKILDSQGNVLAQSIPVKELYADPRTITKVITQKQTKWTKEEMAQTLGEILEIDKENILEKLNQDLAWVSIAHHVSLEKVEEIKGLKLPGIGFADEQKRVYPMGNLGAPILGVVNLAGHGAEGLEAYYDKELYGTPGYLSKQSYLTSSLHEPAFKGANIQLTLNSTIQHIIEQQIDQLAENTQAKRIAILAMEPSTGKILGMGSYPSFDPNNYAQSSPDERRNLNIGMSYEPGSTFKIITGAIAMEEGLVSPNSVIHDPGYIKIGPRNISNWDTNYIVRGDITFTEAMMYSSNVVMAKLGLNIGKENFYTYLRAFGFGSRTGIDLIGEESGLLVPKASARDVDLATMSFGQSSSVTPIQLITAISCVANGGTLYKPYLVDKIIHPDGTIEKQEPVAVRQVISESTSAQMTEVLVEVVNNGTGARAQIPGISVAGKTGTAQKVDPETKSYSSTDFIASFASYAPAEDPKIAVLVVIDTPRGESHHGGTLGGPVAKTIMEAALELDGIPVASNTESDINEVGEATFERPKPQPITPERTPYDGETVVPDLTGLTMRQVGETLAEAELHYTFTGTGLVYSQGPEPGKVVPKGSVVNVYFLPIEEILLLNKELEGQEEQNDEQKLQQE